MKRHEQGNQPLENIWYTTELCPSCKKEYSGKKNKKERKKITRESRCKAETDYEFKSSLLIVEVGSLCALL